MSILLILVVLTIIVIRLNLKQKLKSQTGGNDQKKLKHLCH